MSSNLTNKEGLTISLRRFRQKYLEMQAAKPTPLPEPPPPAVQAPPPQPQKVEQPHRPNYGRLPHNTCKMIVWDLGKEQWVGNMSVPDGEQLLNFQAVAPSEIGVLHKLDKKYRQHLNQAKGSE